MNAERWGSGTIGRNNTVAYGGTVWTVANARSLEADFDGQVAETFAHLDSFLQQAGSSREQLLSVQVILADIRTRDRFNVLWCKWVGDNQAHWPQRAVFGAALASGLLLEVTAVAARPYHGAA